MEWSGTPARRFSTGVSLHSHTLHSRDTLSFLGKHKQIHGRDGSRLDLARAWWTPPLGPCEAWRIERNHIEQHFGLSALVSLTDHDDIEAPLKLRVLGECRHVPVSVEWTVPHGPTFFHLGVHNVHEKTARSIFGDMRSFTAVSKLEIFAADPGTLIVFNHPAWDEQGIGQAEHLKLAMQFLRVHGEFIHAVELNGFRPWKENRTAWQIAQATPKPIVAGGDRHALEPNTLLDLTNARSFPEFIEQVRSGWSDVLVTGQYREPLSLRVLQSIEETLRDYETHTYGWRRWRDRMFYECDDGVVRPLMTLVPKGIEITLQLLIGIAFLRSAWFGDFVACPRNRNRHVRS